MVYGEDGGGGGEGGNITHSGGAVEGIEAANAPGNQCGGAIGAKQAESSGSGGEMEPLNGEGIGTSVSGVDDSGDNDFVDVSSKKSSSQSRQQDEEDGRHHHARESSLMDQRKAELDDFEGADGEIDSEGQGVAEKPGDGRSEELNSSSMEMRHKGAYPEVVSEISEISEISELSAISSVALQDGRQSVGEAFRADEVTSLLEQDIVVDTENAKDGDAVVLRETATSITRSFEAVAELPAWSPPLDLEIGAYYPQHLDHDDEISPYSLQERIRKAREHQDVTQALEPTRLADTRLLAELVAGAPESQSPTGEQGASAASEQLGKSATLFVSSDNSLASQSLDTSSILAESIAEESRGGEKNRRREKTGVGEAILLGALASGVNKPTWFAFKAVLVALVASLVLLLQVARQSDNWLLAMNVMFLLAIAGTLIILLSWYVSMIGLVPVEKQMAELNLSSGSMKVESKTL